MLQLNLPTYNFRIKIQNNKQFIFDTIRKKFVALTPEESVRQHFIRFLIEEKNYPVSRISIETPLTVNGLKKRCDAVVYNANYTPIAIIEFKAPSIKINQETFDQASVYNTKLSVKNLIISNGVMHYACYIENEVAGYNFYKSIPEYSELQS